MLHRIWALLARSLRLDSRSLWSHAVRLAAVLLGWTSLVIVLQNMRWRMIGAPGLNFLQNMIMFDLFAIATAGIGFFSTAISEEQEEGTLGLMMLTGLGPLGILLGKSTSRLIQASWLIVLQFPFALLAVTLGGVSRHQILTMHAMMLALVFFVANIALLCSVIARRNRTASLLMFLVTIVYLTAAWWLAELRSLFAALGMGSNSYLFITRLESSFVIRRMMEVLSTGFAGSVISPMEIGHVVAGLFCFGLAWLLFGPATRDVDSTAAAPLIGLPKFTWARRKLGRVLGDPLYWKEFHTLLGGWRGLCLKLLGYIAFVGSIWFYWLVLHPNWGGGRAWDTAVEFSMVFTTLLMALDAASLYSRVYSEELQHQTWSSLVLLPRSLSELVYTKFAMVLIGLIPVLTILSALYFGTRKGWEWMAWWDDEPMLWGIVMLFAAGVHMAALWSVFIRWGAVALGAASIFLPIMLFAMCIGPGMNGPSSEDVLGVFFMLLGSFVIAVCHGVIFARLRELASR